MSLQTDIIEDLQEVENDIGNPYFTWNGAVYYFVPSITDYNRNLDRGGFNIIKLMTATVRKYDYYDGNLKVLFASGFPAAQSSMITYNVDGLTYRVESIKHDPTNTTFRLICHSTTKIK